jgi:hypothetical protein
MSTSSMSAPRRIERANAYIVPEGASSSPPWWVMFIVRSFIQSVFEAADVAGATMNMAATTDNVAIAGRAMSRS